MKILDICANLDLSRKKIITLLIEWEGEVSGYKLEGDEIIMDNTKSKQDFLILIDDQFF
ncbi:hypothetical protein NEF87_002153 [Candidatus Lokiarchaeum ossiferum]|uniref:Uncharacterized protein n=1 Tax=Candidatus Lokiarchaeum ossiferum TaxID=2951803 RepID=A0ABY6HQT3_9ARCH|nr:hypothetical protein NEF87_002153 [Candidatus Lokiarchaeum sp. B-35]